MTPPTLYWRVITPSRPASTTNTDVIATLKSQFETSSSYWALVESPNTGTLSIIVRPSSIYSSCSNMNVVIASAITGSEAYRSPDTNTSNGTRLQLGFTPDITGASGALGSGSFKGPNADRPFLSGAGDPLWSGYWHFANCSNISASFIAESPETLLIGFKDTTSTSGTMGAFVGAIIETFDSGSGFCDNRFFGMITGGASSWSTSFWLNTTEFMSTTATAGAAHAGGFVVSGSIPKSDIIWTYSSKYNSTTTAQGMFDVLSGSSATRVMMLRPITFYGAPTTTLTSKARAIGRLRNVYISNPSNQLSRIQAGSIDLSYVIPTSQNLGVTLNDSLYLYPASGSGL